MLERMVFELKRSVVVRFLDACALKNIDPDRAVERLMKEWLEDEAKKLARKEKAPRELARVLRFKRSGNP